MKKADLLRPIDIFAQVDEVDLEKIAALLQERKVNRNAIISRQGDTGDALYIVLSGRVKSTAVDAIGREMALGYFSEGQSFGEMALLTGESYSTTAQAESDVKLLVLNKADFDGFLSQNVPVMLQMMKVIAQRQAASSPRPMRVDAPEMAAGKGKVFTVFSPKGGVGKSTLAVNLAAALARQNPDSVMLMDLSLTFGHDMMLLNLTPRSSLASTNADALRRMTLQDGLNYYLTVHPSSTLRVVAGATRPEEGETVTGDIAKVAIEQFRRYFDYLVIDTGSYFSDPILSALESADKVLMLCSPEISVLRDIRDCQRILNDVVHIPRDRITYLMNYIFPFKTLSKEQFEDALQQTIYMELPYGSDLPAKASLRGESFVETQPGAAISKSIQRLAAQLMAERAGAAGGNQDKKRGFFR